MVLEALDKMSIVVTPLNLLWRQNKEALEVSFDISSLYIFIAYRVTQFDTVTLIKTFWCKLSSSISIPPLKKDLERGFSTDMAIMIITKNSIVRLVECRALSTNLTVACCKSDIVFIFFLPFIKSLISYFIL